MNENEDASGAGQKGQLKPRLSGAKSATKRPSKWSPETMVGTFVEILYEDGNWARGLVSGYYRKEKNHRIDFIAPEGEGWMECGKFLKGYFQVEDKEYRFRDIGPVRASKSIWPYADAAIPEKDQTNKLIGKAVKADWGNDGLFVGLVVSHSRDKSKYKWNVSYLDGDDEWGDFDPSFKVFTLDDESTRTFSWFDLDLSSLKRPQGLAGKKPDGVRKPMDRDKAGPSGRVTGNGAVKNAVKEKTVGVVKDSGVATKPEKSHSTEIGSPGGERKSTGAVNARKVSQKKVLEAGDGSGNQNQAAKTVGRAVPVKSKLASQTAGESSTSLKREAQGDPKSKPVMTDALDGGECGGEGSELPLKKRGRGKARVPSDEGPNHSLGRGAPASNRTPAKKKPRESAVNNVKSEQVEDVSMMAIDAEGPGSNQKKRPRAKQVDDVTNSHSKVAKVGLGQPKKTDFEFEGKAEANGDKGSPEKGGTLTGRSPAGPDQGAKLGKPARSLPAPASSQSPPVKRTSRLFSPTTGRPIRQSSAALRSLKSDPTGSRKTTLGRPGETTPIVGGGLEGRKRGAAEGAFLAGVSENLDEKEPEDAKMDVDGEKEGKGVAASSLARSGSYRSASLSQKVSPLFARFLSQGKEREVATKVEATPEVVPQKRMSSVEDFKASVMNRMSSGSGEAGPSAQNRTTIGMVTDSSFAADINLRSFEASLELLTRSRDRIHKSTSYAIDGAEFGAARKMTQLLIEKIESVVDVEQKIDILYLIDSILNASLKVEPPNPAKEEYKKLVGAGLTKIIEAMTVDVQAFIKLRKVFNVWEERGALSEGVLNMGKELIESIKPKWGNEVDAIELSVQGFQLVQVPIKGPKCGTIALRDVFGSLGKQDPMKEHYGLNNINFKYHFVRRDWRKLDAEIEAALQARNNPRVVPAPIPINAPQSVPAPVQEPIRQEMPQDMDLGLPMPHAPNPRDMMEYDVDGFPVNPPLPKSPPPPLPTHNMDDPYFVPPLPNEPYPGSKPASPTQAHPPPLPASPPPPLPPGPPPHSPPRVSHPMQGPVPNTGQYQQWPHPNGHSQEHGPRNDAQFKPAYPNQGQFGVQYNGDVAYPPAAQQRYAPQPPVDARYRGFSGESGFQHSMPPPPQMFPPGMGVGDGTANGQGTAYRGSQPPPYAPRDGHQQYPPHPMRHDSRFPGPHGLGRRGW